MGLNFCDFLEVSIRSYEAFRGSTELTAHVRSSRKKKEWVHMYRNGSMCLILEKIGSANSPGGGVLSCCVSCGRNNGGRPPGQLRNHTAVTPDTN